MHLCLFAFCVLANEQQPSQTAYWRGGSLVSPMSNYFISQHQLFSKS